MSEEPVVFSPHPRPARRPWASIFAGLAFTYALVITAVLMVITGLFEDEDNRRTLLAWIAMPLLLTFGSWMAVQYGHPALRLFVWLSVVFIAFFIWIAVFSLGPYYVPALALLLIAGFAPWPGPITDHAVRPREAERTADTPSSFEPVPDGLEDNP